MLLARVSQFLAKQAADKLLLANRPAPNYLNLELALDLPVSLRRRHIS
jgi:hypothetical protein